MTFKTGGRIGARLGLATCVFLIAAGAAQARPDVRTMSCAQAQQTVYQYGAAVMTTGQYTFQRFVAGGGYCHPHQWSAPFWAATKDTKRCPLLICRHRRDLFDFGFDQPFF